MPLCLQRLISLTVSHRTSDSLSVYQVSRLRHSSSVAQSSGSCGERQGSIRAHQTISGSASRPVSSKVSRRAQVAKSSPGSSIPPGFSQSPAGGLRRLKSSARGSWPHKSTTTVPAPRLALTTPGRGGSGGEGVGSARRGRVLTKPATSRTFSWLHQLGSPSHSSRVAHLYSRCSLESRISLEQTRLTYVTLARRPPPGLSPTQVARRRCGATRRPVSS